MSRAFGCSVLAMAVATASPARADCASDAPAFNGTITCTGLDPNGLIVSTIATVRIEPGAQVLAGADAAILSQAQYVAIIANGAVAGGSTPGVVLTNGGGYIAVGAGSSISGAAAVLLRQPIDNNVGPVSVDIQNSGQLLGTAGPALIAGAGTYFNNVSNSGGATIGGISGRINSFRNDGTVDGGGTSAVSATDASVSISSLSNTGTIRSVSTPATLDLAARSIVNSGRIENGGSGAAIASTGDPFVTNAAGGRIASAGSTAILATGSIQLTNAGTIVGSVTSTAAAGNASVVDVSAGTIQGDLRLGAGNDMLAGGFDLATGRATGVTGTVDGGAGIDTITARVASDTTIQTIALPTNFERLGIDLDQNATVQLAGNAPLGLAVGGYGTFRVLGEVVTSGPAFTPVAQRFFFSGLNFENRGSITANLESATDRAIELNNLSFANSGSIAANGGDGLRFNRAMVTNDGTIAATGTAVTAASSTILNNGAITSGGLGLQLSGFNSPVSTNNGTISGATTGAQLDFTQLVNSGTISGGAVGIDLGTLASVENLAGGAISGASAAIDRLAGSASSGTVRNAGSINGDVDLSNASPFDSSTDIFINDGGLVRGSVRLGGGDDVYVSDLGGPSGVTGSIAGGDGFDVARYRVRADSVATLALPASFEGVDYELIGDVALTLTAPAPQTVALSLNGVGSADITVDLVQAGRTVLNLNDALAGRVARTVNAPNDLDVISRGSLSLTAAPQFNFALAAVNAGTARFENAGTISAVAESGGFYVPSAIFGGSEIVNSGTISLDNAIGVQDATSLINRGTIVQAAGGSASQGAIRVAKVENSGTIRVDGTAVLTGFGFVSSVDNGGSIESRAATAIQLGSFATLTNSSSGVIRGSGFAIQSDGGATVLNQGTIAGDVMLGSPFNTFASSIFLSDGGTVTGDVRFGATNDLFLQRGEASGVSGFIAGGSGIDTFGRSFDVSTIAAVGGALPTGFERELIEARGAATVVTLTGGTGGVQQDLSLVGDGSIVDRANRAGAVLLGSPRSLGFNVAGSTLGTYANEAGIGSARGSVGTFVNRGTIGSADLAGNAVELNPDSAGSLAFSNSGTIRNDDRGQPAIRIARGGSTLHTLSINNSGTITGQVIAAINAVPDTAATLAIANSGMIASTATSGTTLALAANSIISSADTRTGLLGGTLTLNNSGQINAAGNGGVAVSIAISPLRVLGGPSTNAPLIASVVNSGTIAAAGAGQFGSLEIFGRTINTFDRAAGLEIIGVADTTATVSNLAGGTVAAGGDLSTAIVIANAALLLDNAGTISGNAGIQAAASGSRPSTYVPGAIQGSSSGDDRIVNSGTIVGSIDLLGGNDRIENSGTINSNVFLRGGDDSFIEYASARLLGTVDGGDGLDALIIDATGGGAVNGDQFVSFESFTQRGSGNVTYTGNFNYDTIALAGGTITVAAGTTLRSGSATTITGSDADEAVVNYGTIAGRVALGSGSDSYTDGTGSTAGAIDGGAGNDTYGVALAGDRSGIGARTGFERLGVTGTGTISLSLDQAFDAVSLSGTGLNLQLGGFDIGAINGSDGAERVIVDGDVARIALGEGNDAVRIAGATLNGMYDGGSGTDSLSFTTASPITLAGTAVNFETIALAGNALTVTGTLGSAGGTIAFGDGAQTLTIANGGRLPGSVDLGAGTDSFRLAAGGQLSGGVSGGAGMDAAILDLTADMAITGDALRDFETLTTTGGKTLTFTAGTARFDRIDASGSLNVTNGAALNGAQVQFGDGNDRFAVAGSFTGSADGGAGTDALDLSGGSATAPIAFQTIGGFETLSVSGGVSTIAGTAQFNRIDLTGGRLIGLAGSAITAPQVSVGTGATFGSAGTVVGNIAVGGTLSPGASPGTMTVTGNVSLASGSTTLLELTPTVSDKLLISGTLAIAGGTTLTLTGNRPLTPGAALDLIVANGGISGSFGTINQPSTILGFLRQSSDRIQLFGQFSVTGFNPQVTATVNYVNGVLTGGQASAALIAAIPSLLTNGNASNGAAFAKLNPEAYASATQISIENGLTLAKAARSGAAANGRGEAGAFSFAQGLGGWRSLNGDDARGVSRAEINNYGVLGGLGFGTSFASVAGFVGYLNSRQHSPVLGADTNTDGITAGLIGHAAADGFELSALLAYDGGKADTSRALPGGGRAASHYNLRGWVGDASLSYGLPLNANWSLKPEAGLTYISTRRAGVTETGAGAFSLAVARRLSHATFVDGALTLSGGAFAGATFHPWLSAGVRHQLAGQGTFAAASFGNAASSFSVVGVRRQATLATVGTGISANLTRQLDLYAAYRGEFGAAGTGASLTGGLRLRF